MPQSYSIDKSKDKIIISFTYDYNRLVLPLLVSFIIIGILLYAIQFLEFTAINVISYVVILAILFYITFNSYFEWKRNRLQKFQILDDILYVNDDLFLPLYQIKNIFIEYCNSHYEPGWTLYLENFLGTKKHIIKEQLSEKEAIEIAKIVSEFLNVEVCKS